MWILFAILLAQSVDFPAEGLKALDASKIRRRRRPLHQGHRTGPKDYGSHFNLALAYSFLGKDAESIPQYKTVLELKPGLYEAQINLGILFSAPKTPPAPSPI